MGIKIRNKTNAHIYRLIWYAAIVILPVILVFYILRFKSFNNYLVSLNPGYLIPLPVWLYLTKFFSYCLQIIINFCILLVITKNIHYSVRMVYVAFFLLLLGALLVGFKEYCGFPVPLSLITFFVKINKSFLLLVLFIAGYFTIREMPKKVDER
jgi:hypothetical protein